MKRVVNSSEAAYLLRIDPRDLPAYAREHHVEPLGRVRIGRSTVTRWAVEDIVSIAPAPAGQSRSV
jgi:hypothetical protein